MVFRAEGTDLVLPFTRHVARIEQALGVCPRADEHRLPRALLDAERLLQTREPALLVLLTDGRANVSAGGGDPWEEALAACAPLRTACAGALIVDCEPGPIILGRARCLRGRWARSASRSMPWIRRRCRCAFIGASSSCEHRSRAADRSLLG